MASGASSSPPLPVLSLAAAVVVVLLLAARGGATPPHPLRGVRPLAFDEGYAQIFGSSNLALLRDGRRVRLALDESTGELHLSPELTVSVLTVSFSSRDFGGSRGAHCTFPFSNRSLPDAGEGRPPDFR